MEIIIVSFRNLLFRRGRLACYSLISQTWHPLQPAPLNKGKLIVAALSKICCSQPQELCEGAAPKPCSSLGWKPGCPATRSPQPAGWECTAKSGQQLLRKDQKHHKHFFPPFANSCCRIFFGNTSLRLNIAMYFQVMLLQGWSENVITFVSAVRPALLGEFVPYGQRVFTGLICWILLVTNGYLLALTCSVFPCGWMLVWKEDISWSCASLPSGRQQLRS